MTLVQEDLVVPVLSSFKDHVGLRYASASTLIADMSIGIFDVDPLLLSIQERIGRLLEDLEIRDIRDGIQQVVDQTKAAATVEEPSEFAKKVLLRLNDAVVPVVLRRYGMDFDYRTHRTLWQFGGDFQGWWATSSHPSFRGTLIFKTANFEIVGDGESLVRISYPNSLGTVREKFLEKLYNAYVIHNRLLGNTYIPAWEIRAIFAMNNDANRAYLIFYWMSITKAISFIQCNWKSNELGLAMRSQ